MTRRRIQCLIDDTEKGIPLLRRLITSAIALCLVLVVCAPAQIATTTSLVGTITDSSGKAIPNARITAVEVAKSDRYTTTTNFQGYYSFEFVRVGTYHIAAEADGFE